MHHMDDSPPATPRNAGDSKRNKLPRQSISFSKPQDAWLKAEAARLGISESEIVRHAVDMARGARSVGSQPVKGSLTAAGKARS